MDRVSIRDLDGAFFQQAAESGDVVGITNNRQLAAVLLPITRGWVDQIVDEHFSAVARNVTVGQASVDAGQAVTSWEEFGDTDLSSDTAELAITRRVGIRDLSGALLKEAAEKQERLGVLNNGQLCAVLIPITSDWVNRIIDRNLSRVVDSIAWGQKVVDAGDDALVTGDDLLAAPETQLA